MNRRPPTSAEIKKAVRDLLRKTRERIVEERLAYFYGGPPQGDPK